MSNLILSLNAGSSSLKISVYQRSNLNLLLTANVENISNPPVSFNFNGNHETNTEDIKDHASAFARFLSLLGNQSDHVRYVCHRIVHGGHLSARVLIDDQTYHHIHSLSDLAPLHNGPALSVIKACVQNLPNAKSVAYFDSAFHKTIPKHISTYPIDQNVALKRGLFKYGFHGLSYAFILRSVSAFLAKQPSNTNIIILHLGSGASACAIQAGRSLDTSMGLTPLSGLPGATRSGTVDPSLIFHFTNKAEKITHDPKLANDIRVTEAEDILNRKSGWKALTGTADFRLITKRADVSHSVDSPNPNETTTTITSDPYTLAFDLFVDRILDFVGAYHLKLGGVVDALVFSGGIGEHSKELRQVVGRKIKCLGYAELDREANEALADGVVIDIGIKRGKRDANEKRLLVCRTDEQVEMARACALDQEFWN